MPSFEPLETLEGRLLLAMDSPVINLVDQFGDVGSYSSLALTSTQRERIAYYDATNGNLKLASWNGSAWSFQAVDSTGDVGRYASLKLYKDNPRIAYYDVTNGNLKYASWNGSAWQIQTVDSTGDVGQYASLAIDSLGRPHIAYYDATNGDLKSAIFNGATWSITSPDVNGDMGKYASLALTADGYDYVAYYDATNGYLKLVNRTPAGWNLATLDTSADVGQGASLALDSENGAYVSYFDATNGNLKMASFPSGVLQVQTICPGGQYSSLVLDSQARPQIAFEDAALNRLKYAYWDGQEWDSSAVMDLDTGIGQYVSLVLDGNGNGRMAYYCPANGNLQLGRIPTDTEAPMALSSLADVVDGTPVIYVYVSYFDNRAIDVSTLSTGDVRVEGPNGYVQIATFDHVDNDWDNTPRQGVYTITAPSGDWSAANNGVYRVYVQASEVRDTAGLAVPAGAVASFDVNIGAPSYPLDRQHPFTFLDADGDKVTVSLGGAGFGSVVLNSGPEVFISSITLEETDTSTRLTIKVSKARTGDGLVQLKDLNNYATAMGSINATKVDLRGSIYLGGGVGKLAMHDVLSNGINHGLTIGSDGSLVKSTLAFNNVQNLNIGSDLPINSLSVASWIDVSGTVDSVTAPWLGTLKANGDFQPDILLFAPLAPAPALKTATIKGGVSSAKWDLSGAAGKITISGSLTGSTIRADGSIASIKVGACMSSDILAGVSDLALRHATYNSEFEIAATIGSFTVTGLKKVPDPNQTFFSDSNISAQWVGKITIANLLSTNDEDFGLWVMNSPVPPLAKQPPPVKQLILATHTGKVKSVPAVSTRTDQFVVEIL